MTVDILLRCPKCGEETRLVELLQDLLTAAESKREEVTGP